MNVFVLSTGRCGSMTFEKACQHINNYTTAHESRVHCLGKSRLAYPVNHIESDNRLSWFLGRLEKKYGNDAFYVHLIRNPQQVANSFAPRTAPGQILFAYGNGVYMHLPYQQKTDNKALALDYVSTVNANISAFLKDKTHHIQIDISNAKDEFKKFWEAIGAKGNLDNAMAEFDHAHNASVHMVVRAGRAIKKWKKKEPTDQKTIQSLKMTARKAYRVVRYFPEYLLSV